MLNMCVIRYLGHKLAKDLAERGIQTRLIIDSAVFAMMSKVNMVLEILVLYLELTLLNWSQIDFEFKIYVGYSWSSCYHG